MKIEIGHGLTLYLDDPDCPLLEFKSDGMSSSINVVALAAKQSGIVARGITAWLRDRIYEAEDTED